MVFSYYEKVCLVLSGGECAKAPIDSPHVDELELLT